MGATGMKVKILPILVAVIGLIALSGAPAQAQCDRQCLEKLMKDYVAALVKHNPAGLPFAGNAKFTENTATAIGASMPYGVSSNWE